jgi:plastocyanin
MLVVNQGDTIKLTVESNDTDGAHTWTIEAPTGPGGALQLTQLNVSVIGQWKYFPPLEAGPQFGVKITAAATGCVTMDKNVTCNTTGGCSINGGPIGVCTGSFLLGANVSETASIQASTTFGPLTVPGIYKYFCFYHQNIGMVGYLVVLPNKAYTP